MTRYPAAPYAAAPAPARFAPNSMDTARFAELDRYGILDTPPEQGFDDIVYLATQICLSPLGSVSLIADGRQWFKARIGLEPCQTPLERSVCVHGLGRDGPLIIPDLTQDDRTRENPAVKGEPFIRFYAGARLETPRGIPVGMLCVIDTVPRPDGLSAAQVACLDALGRQVVAQMELHRLARERALLVQEAHQRVRNSLQTVWSILSLQARSTDHPDAARHLRDGAGRIATIAGTHEHLYRSEGALEVDLAVYIGDLTRNLRDALATSPEKRPISFDAEIVQWPATDATTIGLIVNELVTNALKFGTGGVMVSLRRSGDLVVIAVADDGPAPAAGVDILATLGLGLRIVRDLLSSRGGWLELDRSWPTTRFVAYLQA